MVMAGGSIQDKTVPGGLRREQPACNLEPMESYILHIFIDLAGPLSQKSEDTHQAPLPASLHQSARS